jgi:rhodanese-related sulfurtransferase
MPELNKLEKQVSKIQQKLIDRPYEIADALTQKPLKEYSLLLAKHYFPRAKSEVYLEPATEAFTIDLATAPLLHAQPYLWRYNYDDLDILSNFYKFTNHKHKYFHIATGELPPPTIETLTKGCQILGINYKKPTFEKLLVTYQQRGLRSRIAARILEQISGVEHDHQQNKLYGFMLDPSKRNLRAVEGLGKFRYLRKGRTWLALGTAEVKTHTKDLRKEDVEIFNYTISFKNQEVKTAITKKHIEVLKLQIKEILNDESSIYIRLKKTETFYKSFFLKHRFTNIKDWKEVDIWLKNQSSKARKSYPKFQFDIFKGSLQSLPTVYQPRRSNFFWNPSEELHCNFITIWNPYNWQEP